MIKMACLFCLFISSIGFASEASDIWHQGGKDQKRVLIKIYREFYSEYSESQKMNMSEWKNKTVSLAFFMNEAWAAFTIDCIYAGWPSTRVGGLCSSPARFNPDYQQGSCNNNEMQCPPIFFGSGLCVPIQDKHQRQNAYANCTKEFIKSGRNTDDVFKEMETNKREASFLDMIEKARDICQSSQPGTAPMCSRLLEKVAALKASFQ